MRFSCLAPLRASWAGRCCAWASRSPDGGPVRNESNTSGSSAREQATVDPALIRQTIAVLEATVFALDDVVSLLDRLGLTRSAPKRALAMLAGEIQRVIARLHETIAARPSERPTNPAGSDVPIPVEAIPPAPRVPKIRSLPTPPSDRTPLLPPEEISMRFIQAKNYQWAKDRPIALIVIHTMESPEKPGTAGAVAQWFAGSSAPMASAHVCVDADEIVECVKPEHIAFGAPKANRNGIHIEHAGRAAQSSAQWADEYSVRMLALSARYAAGIAARYGIPIRRLTPGQIAAGEKGFCGHVDVTHAFRTPGGHVDPGPEFPWDLYLTMVQQAGGSENV